MNERPSSMEQLYDTSRADQWKEGKTMEHASGIWGRDRMLEYLRAGVIEPGDTVLDEGAGAGYPTLKACEMAGPDGMVIGLERSAAMLGIGKEGEPSAQEKYQETFPNLHFVQGDVTEMPIDHDSIDKAVSFMVLHNLTLEQVQACFKETARVLRDGGLGVFLTMSPKALDEEWDVDYMRYDKQDLDALKNAEDKEGLILKGQVRNVSGGGKDISMVFHTAENLESAIQNAGLEIISIEEIKTDEKTAREKFGDNAIRKNPTVPIFEIITVTKPIEN